MPFILVLPMIVFGILITVLKAAEHKKRAQAQQNAPQMQQQQAASEGQASYTPVKPSVQTPSARKVQPTAIAQKEYKASFTQSQKHPEHDLCALRPDEHEEQEAHTGASAQHNGKTPVSFSSNNILQGIIYSEIFGKPKALR